MTREELAALVREHCPLLPECELVRVFNPPGQLMTVAGEFRRTGLYEKPEVAYFALDLMEVKGKSREWIVASIRVRALAAWFGCHEEASRQGQEMQQVRQEHVGLHLQKVR